MKSLIVMHRRRLLQACVALPFLQILRADSSVKLGQMACQYKGEDVANCNIEAMFERYRSDNKIPALSVAVIDHGEIRYQGGLGSVRKGGEVLATADTTYNLYSVSKVFTATAVMQLVERGRVDLDAEVRDYLPDANLRFRGSVAPKVTVRQLLMHRGGYVREFSGPEVSLAGDLEPASMAAQLPAIMRERMRYEPGSQSRYSNIHYALLGGLIESVSGQGYGEYLREHVLQPLHMDNTSVRWTPDLLRLRAAGYVERFSMMDWMLRLFYSKQMRARLFPDGARENDMEIAAFQMNPQGYGSLIGTVADLAKFMRFHLDLDNPQYQKVLSAQARLQMRESHGNTFAMAWAVGGAAGQRSYSHSGGGPGYGSFMCMVPARGFAAIVLGNRFTSSSPPVSQLLRVVE